MPRQRISVILASFVFIAMMAQTLHAQEVINHGRPRIQGGVITDIKDHPWQVAFHIDTPLGTALCGGSLVKAKWVLTAKHCFKDGGLQPSDVKFKSGITKIDTEGNWSQVERIILHDKYDVALVKLDRMPKGGRIIPLVRDTKELQINEPLEITGWGVTENDRLSNVLRKASVPYVSNDTCNIPDAYNGGIQPHEMCAGYRDGGIDSCQGDSGGPLVQWISPEEPLLVGVVSWGTGCALKMKYGVYVRASSIYDWVDKVYKTDLKKGHNKTAPTQITRLRNDFPDPKTFQTGDFIWPKKKGAVILRMQIVRNKEKILWEAQRDKILSLSPSASGISSELASRFKKMSYEEFRRNYYELPPKHKKSSAADNRGGMFGAGFSVGHVGIIDIDANGTPYVIEATVLGDQGLIPKGSVIRTPYSEWLNARADSHIWHGRARDLNASVRKDIAKIANKEIGKPYNFFNFNLNDNSGFYCSKLAWMSVWRAASKALDRDRNPKRFTWFSPKQMINVKSIKMLHNPGNY